MNDTVETLLERVYPERCAKELTERIHQRLSEVEKRKGREEAWCASDIVMITYGDSVSSVDKSPLQSMRTFLAETLSGLVSHVHLLPFFPYTSDDGFAVKDYRAVDEVNGTWEDIHDLGEDVELIFDLVINHASASHPHFQQFLADQPPGNGYFQTAKEDEDVSQVTRPRASPLLQRYETSSGPRWVWCSFSRDQVDWDFSNPDVLYEFVDIFLTYYEHGASWIRLDAIAFLWKELGTACVHLPETHAVVKLLRLLGDQVSSSSKILTETNVPLPENLSYFGDGDEADIIYNFSLPPLLVHGLLTGNAEYLTSWCNSLPSLPKGCTYLNFTASHDGIGLRPAEGILDRSEVDRLIACVRDFGGRVTERQRPDGTLSPYEANISLYDAFKGTVKGMDEWQAERFLASQAVMLSLVGVPALYYNSFLSAPNNYAGFEATGRNRTLNRKKWTLGEIRERFAKSEDKPAQVLNGLKDLLRVRKEQPAFHPEGTQQALEVDSPVFILRREAEGHVVLCLINLSDETIQLSNHEVEGLSDGVGSPLYQSAGVNCNEGGVELPAYGILWLSLADSSS